MNQLIHQVRWVLIRLHLKKVKFFKFKHKETRGGQPQNIPGF